MSLFRTATRAAVASSVHGRVQRRQQARWAAESQAPMAPQPAAGAADTEAILSALERLSALHANGVLTDAEFQVHKARILGQ